ATTSSCHRRTAGVIAGSGQTQKPSGRSSPWAARTARTHKGATLSNTLRPQRGQRAAAAGRRARSRRSNRARRSANPNTSFLQTIKKLLDARHTLAKLKVFSNLQGGVEHGRCGPHLHARVAAPQV